MSDSQDNTAEFLKLVEMYDAEEAKLAQTIGIFSMRFAHLEGQLNWATTILLETTEPKGRVLMAAIRNVSTRLDVFFALVLGIKMDPSVRSRLSKCAKEIVRLNKYRNNLLHNRWTGWDGSAWQKIWTKTDRSGAKYQQQAFKSDDIRAEANNCLTCVTRLTDGIEAYQKGGIIKHP